MAVSQDRYAEALFMLSDAQEGSLKVLSECYEIPEVRSFFNNPSVKTEKKREVLSKVLAPFGDPVLRNFILLLTDKNRLSLISGIEKSYRRLADKARGIQRIKIHTARPLTKEHIDALKQKFNAECAEVTLDPLLLGGLKVQVDDKIYDNSLKTKLSQMLGSEINER